MGLSPICVVNESRMGTTTAAETVELVTSEKKMAMTANMRMVVKPPSNERPLTMPAIAVVAPDRLMILPRASPPPKSSIMPHMVASCACFQVIMGSPLLRVIKNITMPRPTST